MGTLQPKLRFSQFKGDWRKKKIDDVSELTSSKRVYLSDYVEKGIPFYRGKEITELKQNKQPSDILYITEKSYIEFKSKYGVPQINDILMTAVGTLGNVYKIKDNNPFYFKDGNLIWFRDIKESSDFLEILLDYKNNDIQKTSIGSTQRALTMVELRKLFFFFPSLEEQTKIANFLSSVDEKLNLLKEKKALLEDYKKGIMQKIFNQEIRIKDDNGNNFEDWVEKSLGNIAEVNKGNQLNKDDLNDFDVYPSISGGIEPSGYTDKFNRNENTIIISEGGNSCGYVNFIKTKFWCGGHCYSIDILATDNFDNDYLYQLLKFNQNEIMALRVGSGLPNIQKKDLKNFLLKLSINKIEQTKISNFLSAIDEKIELVSNQILDTQEYKKGLLQQMFV